MAVHGSADWRHRSLRDQQVPRLRQHLRLPRTRHPSRHLGANRAPSLRSRRRPPRNPQQAEDRRTRAGPEGLTGRCVRLPVETRTGPRSALGWTSERTASQSNLAQSYGVTYRPSLPRLRFAEATRQDGCRLERELTPHPEPKPNAYQSITDLKLSEYEHV